MVVCVRRPPSRWKTDQVRASGADAQRQAGAGGVGVVALAAASRSATAVSFFFISWPSNFLTIF